MKRSALALAALALSTVGPSAQPSPYYDAWRDAELELGARYVYGRPSFKAKVKDFDGSPISRLGFTGIDSHSGEIFARINHRTLDVFLRGGFGFGYNIGGRLRDDDYAVGLGTISSTTSKLSNAFISDVTVDIGWTPVILPGAGLRFGPFAGFLYRNDVFTARGVTCNPDDVGGALCGAPGAQPVASSTKVIRNDVRWTLPRIGLEASMPITDDIGVRIEGSYLVPGLEGFRNEDSHYLRQSELGPVPNFVDTSTRASGFTLQGSIDYRIGERTSIGVGARRIVLDSGVAKGVGGAGLPADQQSASRAGGVFQTTQGFLQLKVSY
ncbi:hypothetical protein BHAOGJBA_1385 [Methylobacterium hispanicum]|uniref:Outer membrane protein beta-barrel domain-containing protein n=1 Tax=Methylobacterium hispanicum TaxID=270350 RepID=A0AAV4ZIE9_9HYPH|nr:hypothetical protein [Methylobacterium hispanicum]GJD87879.1 hypothetical protein BHAOGJBA_1385 [Methylobacterium hispanicum]